MIVLLIPVIYIRQEYYANAIYLIIYLFINLLEPLELIIDLSCTAVLLSCYCSSGEPVCYRWDPLRDSNDSTHRPTDWPNYGTFGMNPFVSTTSMPCSRCMRLY